MLFVCIVLSAPISSAECIVVCGKPMMSGPPWSTKLTKTLSLAPDASTRPVPTPCSAEASPVSTLTKVSGVTSAPR